MKVAVTYENGRVFQHFGKTQMFLTADVVDGDARMALSAFASQALADDPSKKCTHHAHEEGHSCADHSCQK